MLRKPLKNLVDLALGSSHIDRGHGYLLAHLVEAKKADFGAHVFQDFKDGARFADIVVVDALQAEMDWLDELVELGMCQEHSELSGLGLFWALEVVVLVDAEAIFQLLKEQLDFLC